jgi:hypothetical protein
MMKGISTILMAGLLLTMYSAAISPNLATAQQGGNMTAPTGGASACDVGTTNGAQTTTTIPPPTGAPGGSTAGDTTIGVEGAPDAGTTTATGEPGGNQSLTEVRNHIEDACISAQNNDMQGVLMHLSIAVSILEAAGVQANMTTMTTSPGFTGNATDFLAEDPQEATGGAAGQQGFTGNATDFLENIPTEEEATGGAAGPQVRP